MAQYKNKRKRKLSKKRLLDRQTKPIAGDVLKYFQQYDPEKHSHYEFVLIPRVSTVKQAMDGDLSTQYYRMEKFIHENNLKEYHTLIYIVHSAYYSGNPKELADQRFQMNPQFYPNPRYYKPHYPVLKNIVDAIWTSIVTVGAKDNFAFLFECVDRAIRSDDYSCINNKDAPLSEEELKMFREVMRPFPGIRPFPVITISHPLDTFDEIESWRKIYGAGYTPVKAAVDRIERYGKYHDKVIRLYFEEGLSYQQVFEKLEGKIKLSTIEYWCQEHLKKQ